MADTLSDVQKRFDKLVGDIIGHIHRIINKLKKEKENTIRMYNAQVQGYRVSRMEAVDNRKAEFDESMTEERIVQIPEDKRGEFDELLRRIQILRRELGELMEREMQIESGVALKIKDEPARIDKEIQLMNGLLEYIKSHVKVGKLFSKGRLISLLNTKAIYERIKEVYDEVKSRETEGKVVEYYFEMKKEIEQKSEEILSGIRKLMAILGKEEAAVSPKAVKTKEKAAGEAEKVLKREENYFMLFSDVIKQLRAVAASNIDPKRKLKEAQALLKKLERYERREQWRASARKLEGKLKRLSKIPSISQEEKQEIEKEVRELKIFEGDLLVETVKGLGEKIKKGVQAEQVNWQEIIAVIDQIQKDIQAVIAVDERLDKLLESERRGIRGRVGAGLGAAGRVLGGAPGFAGRGIRRARSGIGDAGLRAVIAKENIAGGIGGAIGRLPNPLPSLRKWASNVFSLAGRLRGKKGKVTAQDIAEAEGAVATEPEVEKRVNALLQVAQGIRNFNPGKSARLTGLANRLRELKKGIVARLRNLRRARTPQEAKAIATQVEQGAVQLQEAVGEAETELQQIIMQNVRGTPTGITRELAEDWLKKVMPDIDVETATRQIKAKYPQGIKPGVAERTQRSKMTNLHGGRGGGFKSNAKEPERTIPRQLRMQSYNRSAAKRDARIEIEEGLADYEAWLSDIAAGNMEKAAAAAPEAERRLGILTRIAEGFKEIDPRKSDNIMRVVDGIKGILTRLKILKGARTSKEAKVISDQLKESAKSMGLNIKRFRKNIEEEVDRQLASGSNPQGIVYSTGGGSKETLMAQRLREAGILKKK